jgi:Trk K+ transport system NAD-binding subunit
MRNIAVIGLGKFGSSLARALTEKGVEVLAIDRNREPVDAIKDSVTHAATLSSTDEDALRALDARNKFSINIVAIKKQIPGITDQGERIMEESIEDVPKPDDVLEETDRLLIVGSDKNVEKFANR